MDFEGDALLYQKKFWEKGNISLLCSTLLLVLGAILVGVDCSLGPKYVLSLGLFSFAGGVYSSTLRNALSLVFFDTPTRRDRSPIVLPHQVDSQIGLPSPCCLSEFL